MNDIENYGNRYHVLQSFPMPQLASSREIRILLPASYYESDVSYPVLYMHDGQNLFDKFLNNFTVVFNTDFCKICSCGERIAVYACIFGHWGKF